MGEPQTLHFYDFGTFEWARPPETNYFYLWKTPGHLNKSRKVIRIFENMIFYKSHFFDFDVLSILEKAGAGK